MSKMFALTAVLATALGGWMYEGMTPGMCGTQMDALKASYQQKTGNFGHGEMMSGLRTAEMYCEAGDVEMASTVLKHLAQSCRHEGGCA